MQVKHQRSVGRLARQGDMCVSRGRKPAVSEPSTIPSRGAATPYCCFAGGDEFVLEPELDVEFELPEF